MMIFIPVDDGKVCCAFFDTVYDRFVETVDGCHKFGSLNEILELPDRDFAERLAGLVPEGHFDRKSTYFDDSECCAKNLSEVAAYLLDRADQYETESPCWIALADAAANVLRGEAQVAAEHGEFDEEMIGRVACLRDVAKREARPRPVNPKLGVEE